MSPDRSDLTARVEWAWVQPKDQAELLSRLLDARDLNVPERERENLCACAHAEILKLVEVERDILRMFRQEISASKLAELHGFDALAFGQAVMAKIEANVEAAQKLQVAETRMRALEQDYRAITARWREVARQLKTMVELWEWCHPPNSTAVIAAIAEAKATLAPPDDCPHCRGTGRICSVCLSSEESCQCPTFSEGEDCVCRL